MALLTININMHDVRADVTDQVYDGGPINLVAAACRQIASDSLHLVSSMASAEDQGRLQIAVEVGANPAVTDGDPASTVGFAIFKVCVVVDDELAARHRDASGPVHAFVAAVIAGLQGAFFALPDAEGFFDAIGVDFPSGIGDHLKLGTSVTLFA